jgi:phage shock protein PspC (stress-responsive transcriptional regulator)
MRLRRRARQSGAMTTTDEFGGYAPPPTPPPPASPLPPQRVLRRSRTDRVGAGVAGGLGEYFGVDAVLFRVLFATAAFFGGAGVLAYLLAWAAIPEQGTVNAPIDRSIAELRRRRIPVWLLAVAAGLLLWGVAFSWWAPGHFFPVVFVVIILVAVFGRRGRVAPLDDATTPAAGPTAPAYGPIAPAYGATAPVSLEKGDATAQDPAQGPAAHGAAAQGPAAQRPAWVDETRLWIQEAKQASRLRRRRAMPVRLSVVGALVATLGVLAALDAVNGIAVPTYFWATLIIVGTGLLVGMVLRRTPWTLTALLVPAVIGLIAFGGTDASLHDGSGQREWTPTTASQLHSNYRMAFGQTVLDLRHVSTMDAPRTVDMRLAAGQVRILVPAGMNVTVDTDVHLGNVTLDGSDYNGGSGWHADGVNVSRTILPPPDATGPLLTIRVHVADGNISVERRS